MRSGVLFAAYVAVSAGCAGVRPVRDTGLRVAQAPGEVLCVQGWLTSKGADGESYWSITDDSGGVWRLAGLEGLRSDWPTRHANQRVAVSGEAVPAVPLRGLRVQSEHAGECPGILAGE
jgi:hypothetical protein